MPTIYHIPIHTRTLRAKAKREDLYSAPDCTDSQAITCDFRVSPDVRRDTEATSIQVDTAAVTDTATIANNCHYASVMY